MYSGVRVDYDQTESLITEKPFPVYLFDFDSHR